MNIYALLPRPGPGPIRIQWNGYNLPCNGLSNIPPNRRRNSPNYPKKIRNHQGTHTGVSPSRVGPATPKLDAPFPDYDFQPGFRIRVGLIRIGYNLWENPGSASSFRVKKTDPTYENCIRLYFCLKLTFTFFFRLHTFKHIFNPFGQGWFLDPSFKVLWQGVKLFLCFFL